ncbi:MAG: peptidylprolyl isomerase [Pirellulaceae bacterium]|jgi:hypothetical protein|nr:peptidylprolyl isomerase [Pirellulaceae bacterium]
MQRHTNKSRRVGRFTAIQLVVAWGSLWGVSLIQPSWGQTAPQAASTTQRVVSLPPPPGRGTKASATPAHVPLPKRSPEPESLVDGMSEFLPPLPAMQLPATQQIASASSAPGLPALPPLPNSAPNVDSAVPLAYGNPGSSMPRMTQPVQSSMGYGSMPVPSAGVTNTLASHSLDVTSDVLPSWEVPGANFGAMPEAEEFPAGRLIAVVGYEHILAGDMAVFVEPIIEQNRAKIPTGDEEKKIRSQLTRQALRQYVEIKAIYQEFFRDMVGTVPPKELAETKKKVITRAGKIFFEKQVPVLMEKYKVNTLAELEQKLTDKSLSITTLRGQFIEQVLASELERKFIPQKFEIDRRDLIDAYRDPQNAEKWKVDGRVRWQQLTVRFDKHATREEAEARIRELGNEVFFGKPFEAVAKQSSEGYTASDGGVYDWTTQGSLKSKELDHALFVLTPGDLSQVIEDDIGLHIVRVLEREAGHVQDFTEAQVELRESLSEERRHKEVRAFRDRIMDRTTVWTLWPQDIPGSRPLSEALGQTE